MNAICNHVEKCLDKCQHGNNHKHQSLSDMCNLRWCVQMNCAVRCVRIETGNELQKDTMQIYLIGSLRNPQVPIIASQIRELGHKVFDDWFAAGPRADDHWKEYEEGRGHSFAQALEGFAAQHVYQYDRFHLDRCDIAVLVMPAGKSGHLEFGYMVGRGKGGYILLDDVDRWDVMYKFATKVFSDINDLIKEI